MTETEKVNILSYCCGLFEALLYTKCELNYGWLCVLLSLDYILVNEVSVRSAISIVFQRLVVLHIDEELCKVCSCIGSLNWPKFYRYLSLCKESTFNKCLHVHKPLVSVYRPPGRSVRRQMNVDTTVVDLNAADIDGCTPLHLAVVGNGLQSFTDIVALLLQHGADPNAHLVAAAAVTSRSGISSAGVGHVSPSNSPLAVACQRGDLATTELLLRHDARDAGLTILAAAIKAGNDSVVGALLKYHHSITDPKFRVNHAALANGQYEFEQRHSSGEFDSSVRSSSSTSSLTGLFIDWHAVGLMYLREEWLQAASCAHIRRCTSGPIPDWLTAEGGLLASYIITKLDVSGNSLHHLPGFIFHLPSLRVLVASNNQVCC